MSLQHAAIHNADNLLEQADMPTYSELLAQLKDSQRTLAALAPMKAETHLLKVLGDSANLLSRIPA